MGTQKWQARGTRSALRQHSLRETANGLEKFVFWAPNSQETPHAALQEHHENEVFQKPPRLGR